MVATGPWHSILQNSLRRGGTRGTTHQCVELVNSLTLIARRVVPQRTQIVVIGKETALYIDL